MPMELNTWTYPQKTFQTIIRKSVENVLSQSYPDSESLRSLYYLDRRGFHRRGFSLQSATQIQTVWVG